MGNPTLGENPTTFLKKKSIQVYHHLYEETQHKIIAYLYKEEPSRIAHHKKTTKIIQKIAHLEDNTTGNYTLQLATKNYTLQLETKNYAL
jgi:hypothetical protein